MDRINPPAIVRQMEISREARVLILKAKLAGIRTRRRLNLEAAIEAGEQLIELKKGCKHGEWLPLLAEIPIEPRMAQHYIAFAKYETRSHLEECESITEAIALLRLGDAEEQEIPEGEQQTTAFAEDETAYQQNGQPAKPPDDKPKPPEPPRARVAYCDTCKRAERVGLSLPKACKQCKDLDPWKKPPKPAKPPSGGFSGHAVGDHFRSILRHLNNLAEDFGLVKDGKVVDTPQFSAIRRLLVEAAKAIKTERDRLKKEAQRG